MYGTGNDSQGYLSAWATWLPTALDRGLSRRRRAKILGLCPLQPCSHTCHHGRMAMMPRAFTTESWVLTCGMPSAPQSPLSAMTKIWLKFPCSLVGCLGSLQVLVEQVLTSPSRNPDFKR